jgi:hypothetical protein
VKNKGLKKPELALLREWVSEWGSNQQASKQEKTLKLGEEKANKSKKTQKKGPQITIQNEWKLERERERKTSSKGTKGLGCAKEGKERKKEKQLQWGSTREVRGKVGETLLRSRRRADETRAYEPREKEKGPQKTG